MWILDWYSPSPVPSLIFCVSGSRGPERGSIDLRGHPDSQIEVVVHSGMVDMASPETPACSFQKVRGNEVVTLPIQFIIRPKSC